MTPTDRAAAMLDTYNTLPGTEADTARGMVRDAITDLLHFAAHLGLDPADLANGALAVLDEETALDEETC